MAAQGNCHVCNDLREKMPLPAWPTPLADLRSSASGGCPTCLLLQRAIEACLPETLEYRQFSIWSSVGYKTIQPVGMTIRISELGKEIELFSLDGKQAGTCGPFLFPFSLC